MHGRPDPLPNGGRRKKKREREREREQQLRAQGGFQAWLYDRKQLWKRMREERKEEKRKAAQREEEERWRQEQEAESLRRQARAHESHLRQTEEARVEALMRGEAAPSQSTAEQILKYGPSAAVGVAHDVRRRAAELAEWDEDDKAGESPGFHRRLTNLTREKLWNQSIAWADGGGGGGGLTPMQRAQAQREDYKRRLEGLPHGKRMDRLWIQSRQIVRDTSRQQRLAHS